VADRDVDHPAGAPGLGAGVQLVLSPSRMTPTSSSSRLNAIPSTPSGNATSSSDAPPAARHPSGAVADREHLADLAHLQRRACGRRGPRRPPRGCGRGWAPSSPVVTAPHGCGVLQAERLASAASSSSRYSSKVQASAYPPARSSTPPSSVGTTSKRPRARDRALGRRRVSRSAVGVGDLERRPHVDPATVARHPRRASGAARRRAVELIEEPVDDRASSELVGEVAQRPARDGVDDLRPVRCAARAGTRRARARPPPASEPGARRPRRGPRASCARRASSSSSRSARSRSSRSASNRSCSARSRSPSAARLVPQPRRVRELLVDAALPFGHGPGDGAVEEPAQQPHQDHEVEDLGGDGEPVDQHRLSPRRGRGPRPRRGWRTAG
jgi:hypothetical protein